MNLEMFIVIKYYSHKKVLAMRRVITRYNEHLWTAHMALGRSVDPAEPPIRAFPCAQSPWFPKNTRKFRFAKLRTEQEGNSYGTATS